MQLNVLKDRSRTGIKIMPSGFFCSKVLLPIILLILVWECGPFPRRPPTVARPTSSLNANAKLSQVIVSHSCWPLGVRWGGWVCRWLQKDHWLSVTCTLRLCGWVNISSKLKTFESERRLYSHSFRKTDINQHSLRQTKSYGHRLSGVTGWRWADTVYGFEKLAFTFFFNISGAPITPTLQI